MPDHTIILPDHALARLRVLRPGDKLLIVNPVDPQPPESNCGFLGPEELERAVADGVGQRITNPTVYGVFGHSCKWWGAEANCRRGDTLRVEYSPSWALPSVFEYRLHVNSVGAKWVHEVDELDWVAFGFPGGDWVQSSPYIVGPHTDDYLPSEEAREWWDRVYSSHEYAWDRALAFLYHCTKE